MTPSSDLNRETDVDSLRVDNTIADQATRHRRVPRQCHGQSAQHIERGTRLDRAPCGDV